MGLDPEYPDYTGGAACAICEDVIFDGKTPFYVEANIFSVVTCPGIPPPDPNGVVLLSQIAPCIWEVFGPVWRYRWELVPGRSIFTIQVGPSFAFTDSPFVECEDTFINDILACNPPAQIGHSGWATIWWGPTIGP